MRSQHLPALGFLLIFAAACSTQPQTSGPTSDVITVREKSSFLISGKSQLVINPDGHDTTVQNGKIITYIKKISSDLSETGSQKVIITPGKIMTGERVTYNATRLANGNIKINMTYVSQKSQFDEKNDYLQNSISFPKISNSEYKNTITLSHNQSQSLDIPNAENAHVNIFLARP